MATITMTHIEYQEMLTAKADADKKIAELEQKLITAATTDKEGRIEELLKALGAARYVIGFAVAHLPPETVKGWPFEYLREFAKFMEHGPVPYDWKEHAIDLLAFARETEYLEKERALRPVEQEMSRARAAFDAEMKELKEKLGMSTSVPQTEQPEPT